jgi:predicted nucleic acid-binding protein
MNVVDSSAWLAYLAGEKNAGYFATAIEDTANLVVPTICLCEVFRVVLRERGENEALLAIAVMQAGKVVEFDGHLALEAATVGHEEGLALADAIIYATARLHGALLWTQDEHFAGKPGVRFRPKRA